MIAFFKQVLRSILRSANLRRDDIDALGVAIPSKLWHWTDEFDTPKAEMDA